MSVNSERIRALLYRLYPADQAEPAYQEITALLSAVHPAPPYSSPYFSERTVTLITYGDSLRQADQVPLQNLHEFLKRHLKGIIDTVHILPFYPYSSDDGFSIIDYYAIDPQLGSWDDVQ